MWLDLAGALESVGALELIAKKGRREAVPTAFASCVCVCAYVSLACSGVFVLCFLFFWWGVPHQGSLRTIKPSWPPHPQPWGWDGRGRLMDLAGLGWLGCAGLAGLSGLAWLGWGGLGWLAWGWIC